MWLGGCVCVWSACDASDAMCGVLCTLQAESSATEYQNTVFLSQLTLWLCCTLAAVLQDVLGGESFHRELHNP
jgi:hypothetical protein